MAIQRRSNRTFIILLGAFFLAGYAGLTGAVAGSQSACNSSNSSARVVWVWQPIPRYACITGPR